MFLQVFTIVSVRREAVLDACGCTSWPRMVIRFSCMMIDALRCAGIAYFLWDDEVLFFTFVPHCLFMSPNTFRSFPVMCFFDRVSEMENLEDLLAAGIQQT